MDTVSVEVPVPPDERLTLKGLKDAVGPAGATDSESVTVPENPTRLESVNVEVPEEPAWKDKFVGFAEMVKLGVAVVMFQLSVKVPEVGTNVA